MQIFENNKLNFQKIEKDLEKKGYSILESKVHKKICDESTGTSYLHHLISFSNKFALYGNDHVLPHCLYTWRSCVRAQSPLKSDVRSPFVLSSVVTTYH